MTKLRFFENKKHKKLEDDYVEVELSELESFGHFTHGKEYLEIPSKKISGKTIFEWFEIDDFSAWWLISPTIHAKYKEIFLFIERFNNLIDKKSISSIEVYGCLDKIDLIKTICKTKKIPLEIKSKNYPIFLLKTKIKKRVKKLAYKKILKEKIRKRIQYYKQNKLITKLPLQPYIITSPGIFRRQSTSIDGNLSDREFFIQEILDDFSKNKESYMCIDFDYTLRGEINTLKKRLNDGNNWIPLEYFLKNDKNEIIKNQVKKLENIKNQLIKNGLPELFIFQNVSMWNYIKPIFDEMFFEPYLPLYLRLIYSFEELLKQVNPKVVIQVYEAGPYAKSIEIASQRLEIKTIALQHAQIASYYPDYIFKEIKNEKLNFGNPVADFTFVFGEYHKRILSEHGSYPKDKLIVSGNTNLRNIQKIKHLLDKNKILAKYKIKNKKIILVPLSFRYVTYRTTEDKFILDKLFKNLKNDDSTIVMVRPHPGDSLNQEILTLDYPSKNFICSTNSLFEDFIISDVIVVLPLSTIAAEAIIFDKPLILVNTVDNDDTKFDSNFQYLLKNNLAKSSSIENIISAINITIDKKNNMDTPSMRENFLNDFFNLHKKIDFVNQIKNLMDIKNI